MGGREGRAAHCSSSWAYRHWPRPRGLLRMVCLGVAPVAQTSLLMSIVYSTATMPARDQRSARDLPVPCSECGSKALNGFVYISSSARTAGPNPLLAPSPSFRTRTLDWCEGPSKCGTSTPHQLRQPSQPPAPLAYFRQSWKLSRKRVPALTPCFHGEMPQVSWNMAMSAPFTAAASSAVQGAPGVPGTYGPAVVAFTQVLHPALCLPATLPPV
mmetsp:Transcript_34378/g.95043  ORF Transcript_34378/g.95043 Transcript_34378/m.95043 type:complete len:214 (+) Transcript_34378:1394-2035(+)